MKRTTLFIALALGLPAFHLLSSCSSPLDTDSGADPNNPGPQILSDTVLVFDTIFSTDTVVIFDSVSATDTVFLIDTVLSGDTVFVTDSSQSADTVYVFDTVAARDTVTLVDTLAIYDTSYVTDTVFETVTVTITDTVVTQDTMRLTDTLVIVDTVTLLDTVATVDTVYVPYDTCDNGDDDGGDDDNGEHDGHNDHDDHGDHDGDDDGNNDGDNDSAGADVCVELSHERTSLVWRLNNAAGMFELVFTGEVEKNMPAQTVVIKINGAEYEWTVQDESVFTLTVDMPADAEVTLDSSPPHAYGHEIEVCLSASPL